MKTRLAFILAILLVLAAILVTRHRNTPESLPPGQAQSPGPPVRSLPPEPPDTGDSPPTPPPPEPERRLEDMTPEEIQHVHDAIDNIGFVLRDYAAALGGNPVGTNAEITAALQGDNARQLKLDLPAGSVVNDSGELCDPWGTPWFFHQLSGSRMELRSAGPDRRLHTADDFVR